VSAEHGQDSGDLSAENSWTGSLSMLQRQRCLVRAVPWLTVGPLFDFLEKEGSYPTRDVWKPFRLIWITLPFTMVWFHAACRRSESAGFQDDLDWSWRFECPGWESIGGK
jgi:hypothetical protein